MNSRPYILTCYHGLTKKIKIRTPEYDKNLKYERITHFEEFDLSFIELKDLSLLDLCQNLDIFYDYEKDQNYKLTGINPNMKQYNYKLKDGEYSLQKILMNYPKFPFLKFELESSVEEKQGLSGSFVINEDDHIFGFLSYEKNSYLYIIPCKIILRCIKEFIKYNKSNGICTIISDSKVVYSKVEDYYGLLLIDTFKINHNRNTSTNLNLLKNNDIIKKVGEKEFDKKGMIDNLPFETYIAMNYIIGDVIKLEIVRKKNDSYVISNIKLNTRPLKSILFINNDFGSYVSYQKFTFKRLTFDDIKKFNVIPEYIKKYIYKTPFRDDTNNYLIICITNNLILTKFNSKNVKSLDSLKELISSNSSNAINTLEMVNENNKNFKFDL
ncbi:MAG: hypothetical protein CMF62_02675 [Magnetococcales bacterium]|nr:hypothetical protein [Magnetococcales bacterium]